MTPTDIFFEADDLGRLADELGRLFGVSFVRDEDEDGVAYIESDSNRDLCLFPNELLNTRAIEFQRYGARLLIEADTAEVEERIAREIFAKVKESGHFSAVLVFNWEVKLDECEASRPSPPAGSESCPS